MIRRTPWLLLLALLVAGCGPADPESLPAKPEAAAGAPDVATAAPPPPAVNSEGEEFWIDVRSPEEYASGHLDAAINIPHDQIADRIEAVLGDRSRPIAVYCRSGRRAGLARETLLQLGYATVRNAGGYEDLRGE